MKRLVVLWLLVMGIFAVWPSPAPAAENVLKARPRTVNFGPTPVGVVSIDSTTLTNRGLATINLTIDATKDWDDFSYGLLPGTTCLETLAPGESCVFVVRFWPSEDFLGLKQDQIFRATATDPLTGAVLDSDRFVFFGRAT